MASKTEKRLNSRYQPLGGIDKALSDYKAGEITMRAIGYKVGVSRTTVENDWAAFLGNDKLEKAKAERQHNVNLRSKIRNINEGREAVLGYDEALSSLGNGTIKQSKFLSEYKKIFELARRIILKPSKVIISSYCVRSIQGKEGSVKIKYAEPNEKLAEYKAHRYRFKILKSTTVKAKAIIFCLKANSKISYYVFPAEELVGIQSLNLQFDRYDTSKYAVNLKSVENK